MEIYELVDDILILNVVNIEKDILNKFKISLLYDSMSNVTGRVFFYINNNISFYNIRTIQKYFLLNIPYVESVELLDLFIAIKINKKNLNYINTIL